MDCHVRDHKGRYCRHDAQSRVVWGVGIRCQESQQDFVLPVEFATLCQMFQTFRNVISVVY